MPNKLVGVEGAQNLQRTLAVAAASLGKLHSEAAGQAVAQRARRLAPRRTGTLASSIRPVFSDTKGTRVMAGGSAVRYAPAQEYGVKPHNIPAHPYMRPALEQSQADVVDAYGVEAQKALDEVKGA